MDTNKKYHKKINISNLKINEIARLEDMIIILGYASYDYKFNHYGAYNVELIISNPLLHRDLKIIRKTKYSKK